MLGEIFASDIFVVLVFAGGGLVVTTWAIYLLTGIVGIVLAIVYLAAIRPRVKAVSSGY